MTKIFLGTMAVVAALTFGYYAYNAHQTSKLSNIALANIEALSRSESLDCNYSRTEERCSIYVGIEGELKLLSGSILKADSEGEISFDGKVICASGGNLTCTPVECKDLYELL